MGIKQHLHKEWFGSLNDLSIQCMTVNSHASKIMPALFALFFFSSFGKLFGHNIYKWNSQSLLITHFNIINQTFNDNFRKCLLQYDSHVTHISSHFSLTDLMYLMVSVAKLHFCQHPITMCIVRGPYWVSVGRFLEKLNGNRYQVPWAFDVKKTKWFCSVT